MSVRSAASYLLPITINTLLFGTKNAIEDKVKKFGKVETCFSLESLIPWKINLTDSRSGIFAIAQLAKFLLQSPDSITRWPIAMKKLRCSWLK